MLAMKVETSRIPKIGTWTPIFQKQLLAGEISSYQREKRYLTKLNEAVWVLLSVSLIRDAAGQPLRLIGQVQDVSKRKRAEAELAQTTGSCLRLAPRRHGGDRHQRAAQRRQRAQQRQTSPRIWSPTA